MFDLLSSKKADFNISLGFNTGRVLITDSNSTKLKNPFFSPSVAITPIIRLGRISLKIKLGYDYDISNKIWKLKSDRKTEYSNFNKFAYQGANLCFGIGYIFK